MNKVEVCIMMWKDRHTCDQVKKKNAAIYYA